MTRQRSIERMSRLVAPRAIALLERVREACPELSFTPPEDEHGDDIRWGMWLDSCEGNGMDAYVEAHLSEECDGSRGGVNFGVHLTGWGGEIIGMCCPRNYTPEVWVRRNDLAAVDARMSELECLDLSGVQDMILGYLSRRDAVKVTT